MNYTEIFKQGCIEYENGNYLKSIELFNSVEEFYNKDFAYYCERGNSYADNGDYNKSISDYTKAINLSPDTAYLYSNRAKSHMDIGHSVEAITDITKAIELDPNDTDFYEVRGRIYISLDNYVEAFDDFNFIMSKDPDSIVAKQSCLFLWNRITEGEFDSHPSTSEEYCKRGIAKMNKGLFDEAIHDYNISIEKDSGNHYAYKSRGVIFLLKEEYATALNDFHQALKLKYCADYLDNLADAYYKLGDLKAALKYANKAVELPDVNARIIYNRGVFHLKSNNLDEAIIDFNRAIELDTNYPEAYDNRGWCYIQQGKIVEGIADRKKSIELKERYQKGIV